jgi:Trk K+ transport system NAD-binding subunit
VLAIPNTIKAALATRRVLALNPETAVIARAHSRDDREGLPAAGATEVILPEIEAGMTLVDHALHRLAVPSQEVRTYLRRLRELERPGARTLEGASGAALLQAATVRVVEGPLAHQSLRRTRIRERTGVTVVGVERPGEEPHWNPPPEAVLLPGDQVTVVGLLDQIERFRRVNAGAEE